MTPIEHFKGLFGLSFGFWLLTYPCAHHLINKFIVRRYKNETSLAQTKFFRMHVPFVLYMPDFFAAGFFGTHLMMCVWGWRIFGNREVFKDIDDPDQVIRYFSRKEIRRVKWVLVSGFMIFAHGVAYFVFRSVWPEIFSR